MCKLKFSIPILFINWIFLITGYGQGSNNIDLYSCYEKAVKAYPVYGDKEALRSSSELRVKNIETNYLPQISVNGQATYQSDVVKINLPPAMGLNLKGPSNDQYKITLDAQQMIYDGGATNKQKKLEQISASADIQQIESDVIRIKEQVNTLYFSALILQENKKLLKNVLEVLKERESTIKAMVKNGVLMMSDENAIMAERLKTEQQIAELEINQSANLQILSLLTNETYTDSTRFILPEIDIAVQDISGRPEFKSYELMQNKIDAASSLTKTTILPKIYAFGQYGYGKPGLNMLNNEFDNFYLIGATLKWNFWDWNKSKREKQIYTIQKQMIINKMDNFTKNLNIDLQNRKATIYKMEEALKRDANIVTLRTGITEIAKSQLNNGVITSTDYLNELNAETQARINLETHKIQLIQAKANYILALGK